MKTLIIVGLIVGLAITTISVKRRWPASQAKVQTTQDQRERLTINGISYVVVSKGEMTLSEGWSSPPIIREPNQGEQFSIIAGKADSYEVKESGWTDDKAYPFTDDGKTTCSGGDSGAQAIDQFVWRTGRIIRGPVIGRFVIYELE